ncbi:family 16 glycoside hydrolase [Bremerella sp. P1]|uniref:family 16 glycoside hydrolase n=1 Tax=Bremerella sp. P1 TaxID=3026424 RepID=UPI002368BAD1|nr:family 16 glycoside hydrolase [Bremerella sp. P1]WDI41034.1 DUF1080 domain-containing protein [Bremerella sp. P1]
MDDVNNMMRTTIVIRTAFCVITLLLTVPCIEADDSNTSIFNSKNLSGWNGNSEFWRVENGAIVGESTAENPVKENTFLVWQGEPISDFEFVGKVRFRGNNSGVQYRSQMLDANRFTMSGYQMDLHPNPQYFGMLYGEKYDGRGIIAKRGQYVQIDATGKSTATQTFSAKEDLTDWDWNTIRIIAAGNRLIHQVNGITTVDVVDNHPGSRQTGSLALQLHRGAPMRVEFKELQLSRLNEDQARYLLETLNQKRPHEKVRSSFPVQSELSTPDGFQVELVYSVPRDEFGSWVSLTRDEDGNLLASDQGDKGLFNIRIDSDGETAAARVERLPVDLSGAQGMVVRDGVLYCYKSGEGIYRVADDDGNGQYDTPRLISSVSGGGEHGNHALIPSDDENSIFTVAGNHTPLPEPESMPRLRISNWKEDQLLPRQWDPRGHARGIYAPGGWISRFDLSQENHELVAIGMRNAYDVTLAPNGDLFTFDSDMEWDLGLPWYRPTRICHVTSGADFGWRSGTAKWPTYYEDTLPPIVDIGPGSPTGVTTGQGARFPGKYQRALFALDWTYGRILAVHLKPEGASYTAEVEEFVSGPSLPVTDAVIGDDGALYFTTGGRGTESALMRVVYTGSQPTEPVQSHRSTPESELRRRLEAFHGVENPKAIHAAWPHLSSSDRFLRYAARLAVESQPVVEWENRVFTESTPQARITSAVALARKGNESHRSRLIEALTTLDFESLTIPEQLGVARAIQLTITRLGKPTNTEREKLIAYLSVQLPSEDPNLSAELLTLLIYLKDPSAVAKGMKLIAQSNTPLEISFGGVDQVENRYANTLKRMNQNPPPTQAIRYAFILRNADQGWTAELRRKFFQFINVAGKASGGASFPGYLVAIRNEALTHCNDATRVALQDITGEDFDPIPDFKVLPPKGPGRTWTIEDASEVTSSASLSRADFHNGRSLFHSAQCGACHRFDGLGGGVGPDLTSIRNKFTTSYVLESIIDPSRIISDQYNASKVLLDDGRIVTGIVVPEGDSLVRIFPSDPKSEGVVVPREEVVEERPSSISQMPKNLLDNLNETELRDLIAYLMSGGDPNDKLYRKRKAKN